MSVQVVWDGYIEGRGGGERGEVCTGLNQSGCKKGREGKWM